MKTPRELLRIAAGTAATVGFSGCGFLAFTDEQLVKNRIRDHDAALTAHDWRAAAAFYDASIIWQQGQARYQGRAAAQGFLGSIRDIYNMDGFYTIVDSTSKPKEGLVEAKVTMQAHLVISSATLDYSNRVWEARMGWVKRGAGKWLVAYIVETSPRKDGQFSRL